MRRLCKRCPPATPLFQAGFTLIEVMIVVAIIAILVAIALPSYNDYVVRGKLVVGTNALAAKRAEMEQYYQDNRTYLSVSSSIVSPCATSTTAGTGTSIFTLSCGTLTATTYIATATGSGLTAGAVYTVNEKNAMYTTGLPTAWGAVPSSNGCWLMRRGETCS